MLRAVCLLTLALAAAPSARAAIIPVFGAQATDASASANHGINSDFTSAADSSNLTGNASLASQASASVPGASSSAAALAGQTVTPGGFGLGGSAILGGGRRPRG